MNESEKQFSLSHIVVWQVAGRFIGKLATRRLLFYPAALSVARIDHLLR